MRGFGRRLSAPPLRHFGSILSGSETHANSLPYLCRLRAADSSLRGYQKASEVLPSRVEAHTTRQKKHAQFCGVEQVRLPLLFPLFPPLFPLFRCGRVPHDVSARAADRAAQ